MKHDGHISILLGFQQFPMGLGAVWFLTPTLHFRITEEIWEGLGATIGQLFTLEEMHLLAWIPVSSQRGDLETFSTSFATPIL